MRTVRRPGSRPHRLPALLIALAAAWLAAGCRDADAGSVSAAATARNLATPESSMIDWKEIERLVSEQKYEAAAGRAAELRAAAAAAGDVELETRALIREVQLRTALHGYERAVRLLREAEWPQSPYHRSLLGLFYAHGLVEYARAYSWEIRQRERVASAEEIDLDSWTLDQIVAEAHGALGEVWARRAAWGAEPLGRMSEFLEPNDYPPGIRDTLRDAVGYLWVELLADTALWRPEESNGVYRLDLEALLAGGGGEGAELDPADTEVHPLRRIGVVLDDLESWHGEAGRLEAAFEARLERLRRLAASFDRAEDRRRLRADLEARLGELDRQLPWWSMGQAELAELIRAEDDPDSLVRARAAALAGAEAHPESVGGRRCRHLVAAIEAPHYDLEGMAADGPRRRSLGVDHKNLERLHFRAYPLDLMELVRASDEYNIVPRGREIEKLVDEALPAAEWTRELPPTPDFRSHRTYVEPPLEEPGLYVVVASTRPDFEGAENSLRAIPLIVGDLVLLTRTLPSALEITVRSGATGRPRPDVRVTLWRRDYRRGHRPVATRSTDAGGTVRFEPPEDHAYFLTAEQGEEVALDAGYLGLRRQPEHHQTTAALVYTDRSVYRPLQQVLWKVVAYAGDTRRGDYRTLTGAEGEVELVDANGETVDRAPVVTSEFGSASGAFDIPAGRLLGGWRLRTDLGGGASVRVEEYKRPTFEVTILDPPGELRLNRPAELTGEARYYFGLPVVGGEVFWRVERQPVFPRWWWWRPPQRSEVVAAGTTELDAEGRFRVELTPAADERDADTPGVSYRYRLTADVTDEGGETRSAERGFRVGFVAVETRIDAERGFAVAGEPVRWTLRRSDLDGSPQAGRGSWRLVEVRQPAVTLAPADQPVREAPGAVADAHRTEGDRLRPRWAPGYRPEEVLRAWPDGAELRSGTVEHGADGVAELELEDLRPGVYRLRYETTDAFGGRFETQDELLVVRDGETELSLPGILLAERAAVGVGGSARLLVHSGLAGQELLLELHRDGRRTEVRRLEAGRGVRLIELPVDTRLRGGFGVRLLAVHDHQLIELTERVMVPWDDREIAVELESFRDELEPGARERWTVRLRGADGEALARGSAELLAYMYDRSLDLFAPHQPPDALSLYPTRTGLASVRANLGAAGLLSARSVGFAELPDYPRLRGDRLIFFDGYPIGGPGRRLALNRVGGRALTFALSQDAEMVEPAAAAPAVEERVADGAAEPPEPSGGLREDFSETAFWEPHLRLEEDGSVAFEFTAPDSVTEWTLWLHALTRDLRAGSVSRRVRTVKELMVRPYLPRFLREGDRTVLRVAVDNAGDEELSGTVSLDVVDPQSGESLLGELGLDAAGEERRFEAPAGAGTTVAFELRAPRRVGTVAFEVTARAGGLSDGERRPLPLLPGRVRLAQSRFAALEDRDRRELSFDALTSQDDPTRIDEQLVVTLDAQLFYSVLHALPYLASYPYECTEQTLNRFLSTGIVASLYEGYPAVARMAEKLGERQTRLETWDAADPNRKMALEETPWRVAARGGGEPAEELINVLDPRIARAERDAALAKLRDAQTSAGGFPWWPGGPPSPYMTLYLAYGFSKALEFDVEVPREPVARAWAYLHRHYLDDLVERMTEESCCWELVTFLNYVLSNYPDESWTGGVFDAGERRQMLDFSFSRWRRHSPLLKGYLALTLARAGRRGDAELVWESVMDSARSEPDLGTFWAPEDRAWLWYNDTIETHALALRVLTELDPDDPRRDGLVHWLLLNKKLNHWKSTRATAEVVYSLVHYLEREGRLGAREEARVAVGPLERRFVFEPDEYTGRRNQIVVAGEELDPEAMSTVVVEKETPGLLFASATWHFSTERLPEAAGDLFTVTRRFFRRTHEGGEWVLRPLDEGERLEVGDQLEVRLTIRAGHAAEYVHLRDPRGAGFEPESLASGYRWDLGVAAYEEVRDSGTNFFFDWLPAGEYTFGYRLRAAAAGTFKAAPATLQSMYAPEFAAYSAGAELGIDE